METSNPATGTRRSSPRLARLLAITALVGGAAFASAGALQWEIAAGWGFGDAVNRAAQVGFRAEALIANAPEPVVVLQRPCCRRRPAIAEYRVFGRSAAPRVADLDGRGFVLRSFAVDGNGAPWALFERLLDGGESRDYRSIVADIGAGTPAELATLAAQGFRVVAAAGRSAGAPDWMLLERRPGATAVEIELVDADGARTLDAALDALASRGFLVDTAWGRSARRISLTGLERLGAAASRPVGSSRPVAQATVYFGSRPESGSGPLVAVSQSRGSFAFVHRDGLASARWLRELRGPAAGLIGRDWNRWNWLQRELRQPVERAWLVWNAGQASRLVLLERGEAAAEAHRASTVVEPPEIPAGSAPLAADGGEPYAAYLALLAAVERRELKAANASWTGEFARRWDEQVQMFHAPLGLGFSEKSLLASLHERMPKDPIFVGGWLRDTQARLRIEGTVSGIRSWSDLDFVHDGGRWKLAAESTWEAL